MTTENAPDLPQTELPQWARPNGAAGSDETAGIVHPSWLPLLQSQAATLWNIDATLRKQPDFLPQQQNLLAALSIPFHAVKVVILGQDPYPTPRHAIGLSFAVAPEVSPLPRSLNNIFQELVDDQGVPKPANGDLRPWLAQGVMLLNRVLSVAPGAAGSHRGIGWETFTAAIITALAERQAPLVGVLWGNDAKATAPLFGAHPTVQSAHPSPLSARRGFFGSAPFSQVNKHLVVAGAQPVDWRL